MKICRRCEKKKPTSEYYPYRRICKSCVNENYGRKSVSRMRQDTNSMMQGWGRPDAKA